MSRDFFTQTLHPSATRQQVLPWDVLVARLTVAPIVTTCRRALFLDILRGASDAEAISHGVVCLLTEMEPQRVTATCNTACGTQNTALMALQFLKHRDLAFGERVSGELSCPAFVVPTDVRRNQSRCLRAHFSKQLSHDSQNLSGKRSIATG